MCESVSLINANYKLDLNGNNGRIHLIIYLLDHKYIKFITVASDE